MKYRCGIAQVKSGEVELIPGDEVLARGRNLLAHLPSAEWGAKCKSLGQRPRYVIPKAIESLKELNIFHR